MSCDGSTKAVPAAGSQKGTTPTGSLAALSRRGLVKTSGRGPTWSASITPAGREYLDQAAKPGPAAPRCRFGIETPTVCSYLPQVISR